MAVSSNRFFVTMLFLSKNCECADKEDGKRPREPAVRHCRLGSVPIGEPRKESQEGLIRPDPRYNRKHNLHGVICSA